MPTTTSRSFDLDRDLGEVTLDGTVTVATGTWVVARVNPDARDESNPEDQWRAYTPDEYRAKVGLVCNCGWTREQVVSSIERCRWMSELNPPCPTCGISGLAPCEDADRNPVVDHPKRQPYLDEEID